MDFYIKILQMVLPVLISLVIGSLCNKKGILTLNGVSALKTVIGKITLPVVLFNAFFTANYSSDMLLIFVVIYICCFIALVLGFLLKRFVKPFDKFFPFLLTGFEGGMLGYALFALLAGNENISNFAMVDIGQTVFAYTVFLTALTVTVGEKATVKGTLKNMFTNNAFIGMFLGLVLGISGLSTIIISSPFGGIITELTSFLSAPTACLILIVVGFEISLKKEVLFPVLTTTIIRLLVMLPLLALSTFIIFSFIPFDKNLFIALMILFSLPAPFITPIFADVGNDGEYIGATYSVHTLVTIGIFVMISVYSTIN